MRSRESRLRGRLEQSGGLLLACPAVHQSFEPPCDAPRGNQVAGQRSTAKSELSNILVDRPFGLRSCGKENRIARNHQLRNTRGRFQRHGSLEYVEGLVEGVKPVEPAGRAIPIVSARRAVGAARQKGKPRCRFSRKDPVRPDGRRNKIWGVGPGYNCGFGCHPVRIPRTTCRPAVGGIRTESSAYVLHHGAA
jgi:hypothetical protein